MAENEDKLLKIAGLTDTNQQEEGTGLLAPKAALQADAGQGIVKAGGGAGGDNDNGNGGGVENNDDDPANPVVQADANAGGGAGGDGGNNGEAENNDDDPANPVVQAVANAGGGAGGDGGNGGESGEASAKEAPKDPKAEKKAKRKRRFNIANGALGVLGSVFGAIAQTASNNNPNGNQALKSLAMAGNIIKGGIGIFRSGVSTVNAARAIHKSRKSDKKASGSQKAAMWGNLISALAGVGGSIGGIGAAATGNSRWAGAAKWSEVLGSGGGLLSIIGSGR